MQDLEAWPYAKRNTLTYEASLDCTVVKRIRNDALRNPFANVRLCITDITGLHSPEVEF
jgi:hypothetical protein